MWEYVPEELGTKREEGLKREVWNDMLGNGYSVERFQNTYQSAWRIVDGSADKSGAQVQLLSEMVNDKLRLAETKVGIALAKESERRSKERKYVARPLREHAEKQENQPLRDRIVV
jgi:hypothetical protein